MAGVCVGVVITSFGGCGDSLFWCMWQVSRNTACEAISCEDAGERVCIGGV